MIPTSFADAAALAVSHVSLFVLLVKATIILVAALGITMAMQRASAGARHLVWLVTLGTLLVMPALTAWGPLPLRVLPATALPSAASLPSSALDVAPPATQASDIGALREPTAAASGVTASAPSFLDGMSGVTIVLAIWGLVVVAICCSLLWSALTVRRIVRNARALETKEWLTPLWEVSDRFALEEAPRLLCSGEAKMPFACGLLTPTIVLPADCESWSLDRRRAVLLHELAHVRRHDLLGHALGRLVCAVYWFHPLAWTAAKQLRSESERACDDLALSCGTRATDYAEHLLDIVTSVRRDATPSVALAMARRKEFEGRMLAILDPQLRRAAPSRRQTATLITTLALLSVIVGAAAPAPRESRVLVDAQQAATAPERPEATPRLSPTPSPTPRQNLLPAPQPTLQPDSRVPRVDRRTSISMSTRTDTTIVEVQRAVGSAVDDAMRIGTSVSASASASPSTALRNFIQSGQGQKSDDRPILLAKVLRTDTSATLRRVAAWGLSDYASTPVAAEALANAVRHDASAGVREMAAWSLADGDDGTAGVVDALSAALRGDADTRVRATAAWALGNVGDRGAIDALVAALADASPEVRTRALWAIGNVGPKQAPRAVVSLLADKEPRVRELAAWALYQIEDPSAAPALEAALRAESDKDLQLAYIRALAAMGEKSVDAIRGLLESPDQRIKTMAVRALAGGHAAGPWPWPWPEPRPYP